MSYLVSHRRSARHISPLGREQKDYMDFLRFPRRTVCHVSQSGIETKSCMNFLPIPRRTVSVALSLMLSACAVGPDYVQAPPLEIGSNYKATQLRDWQQVSVPDDLRYKDWWLRFQDEQLNQLMQELNSSNLRIAQALAQFEAAVAGARGARANLFPSLGTNANLSRAGGSAQDPTTTYTASGTLSWEVDLWGRVRRQVESGHYNAQAAAADLADMRLSMQAQLAKDYFSLRMTDEQIALLGRIVQAYERSVRMNQNRYEQGVAARADVVSATAQLENARAQAINIRAQRQQLESSIAVLLGRAPVNFSLPAQAFSVQVPAGPTVLPSSLLVRRPDIASAERRVASANADIGVAQAAWLPSLNLSANGGLRHSNFADWLSSPLNFWSLGPQLALAIFDGGARQASVDTSKAQYRAQVANYRQTVLTALKEVEDSMTLVSVLAEQQAVQARALGAARESLTITRNQYQAGLIDYLSVTQVENTAYNTEITALQLMSQRLNAAVDLLMALGGGWEVPGTSPYSVVSSAASEVPTAQ